MKKELTIAYEVRPRSALTEQELLLEEKALAAAEAAYAPYSRFRVGAAVLLEDGTIVTGSNQENAAYPSGICAERTALFYAGAQYPHLAPEALVLVALNDKGRVPCITPCGACRQVLMEVVGRFRPFRILFVGADQAVELPDCRALLPFAFDGSDL